MSPTQSIRWPAPAKLNLFLHITGRRGDGYHELQTLFQFIDRCDHLTITPNDSGRISLVNGIKGVAEQDNLIIRAARALQQATGCRLGARIELEKYLPMGGGIGGGSSDAATTLVALNYHWQLGLSLDELAEIGLTLGADVPVFVRGRCAFAEGVGERLQQVEAPEYYYLVLRPDCHIPTPAVFASDQLQRDTPKREPAALLALEPAQWANDCESVVLKKYPKVEKALNWLLEFAPARLTGTGSCVFGVFETEQTARQALQHKPSELEGFIARGCNISPLHQALASRVAQCD